MRVHTGTVFKGYITNNRLVLALCTAFLIFGICAGSIYCVSFPESELSESLADFTLVGSAGRGILLSSVINYFQISLFLWLCGLSKIGSLAAPVIVSLKGFACGFCVSALMMLYGDRGLWAAAIGLVPQMTAAFIIMEIFCVSAINQAIYSPTGSDKSERRRRFFSYCVFCFILFIGFVICSLFESYISQYLLASILQI